MSPAPRSPMPRRTAVAGGIAIAAATVGAYLGWRRLGPDSPSDEAVRLLFDQTLPDAYGQSVTLSRFAARPLVVNFWATWCPPCVEEMPELSALNAELSPKGFHMVGIGVDTPTNIAEFAKNMPVSYPLLVGGMGGTELSRRFGNTGGALPFTVLVDRRGRVAYRALGRVDIGLLKQMSVALIG